MSAEDTIRGVLSRDVLREHSDEEIAVFVAALDSLVAQLDRTEEALREIADRSAGFPPGRPGSFERLLNGIHDLALSAIAQVERGL